MFLFCSNDYVPISPFLSFPVFFSGKWRALRLYRAAKHADQVKKTKKLSAGWLSLLLVIFPIAMYKYITVNFSQPDLIGQFNKQKHFFYFCFSLTRKHLNFFYKFFQE